MAPLSQQLLPFFPTGPLVCRPPSHEAATAALVLADGMTEQVLPIVHSPSKPSVPVHRTPRGLKFNNNQLINTILVIIIIVVVIIITNNIIITIIVTIIYYYYFP